MPIRPLSALRSCRSPHRAVCIAIFVVLCCPISYGPRINAQNALSEEPGPKPADSSGKDPTPSVPQKVEVAPIAGDNDIATRLREILAATGWFNDPRVTVDEGVVFITGRARDEEVKAWAGRLAGRTEGVVAVVNQLDVAQPPLMQLDPAREGLRILWRDTIAILPFIGFGILTLIAFWLAARLTAWTARRSLRGHVGAPLLREVLARAFAVLVFLLGVYIVLRVSGLTRLALTVIGGTGILGLVIGIAFRDITENFLAGIFLSMRRPFLVGDLVEIVNVLGYVQSLTTRSTVLMTLNGNRVEIPNSVVYKNTIRNFSTNKNRREDFTIGIGYSVRIPVAQETVLRVLRDHPSVLSDPEPWALVDSLGSAVVVLRVYFWLDGSKHSWLKVRSSVIRLVKRAFQDAGISMPDEAREIVFPQDVPVRLLREELPHDQPSKASQIEGVGAAPHSATESACCEAEGGLGTEATDIKDQVRQSRKMEGENLLNSHARVGQEPA